MLKAIERAGRRFLVAALAFVLAPRRRPVTLPKAPRILVVRLDERVGNLVLSTPLLASLRARFPEAHIDVLGASRGETLLAAHPAVNGYLRYRKWALFAADGPLGTLLRLRRAHYDLAIDAGNPLDPSTTHALIVRWSGATHTVGAAHGPFARLYSAPVPIEAGPEIDMRVGLLAAIPGDTVIRALSLGRLPVASSPRLAAFAAQLSRPYAVLNIGARTVKKRLPAGVYAQIADTVRHAVVLTYGPAEEVLAREVASRVPRSLLAPPTALADLVHLMSGAMAVISCDTGPMHVAVATGKPTCGIFVSTDPARYGYGTPPHCAIDARRGPPSAWLPLVSQWLGGLTEAGSRSRT